MANKNGWWKLEISEDCNPDDFDLEHIANMIKQGYTEGEVIGIEDEEDCDEVRQCPICGMYSESYHDKCQNCGLYFDDRDEE